MHLAQREKKIENGDFGRKLGKVKSREMVLSGKMRLFELASSSFFHLFLAISYLHLNVIPAAISAAAQSAAAAAEITQQVRHAEFYTAA